MKRSALIACGVALLLGAPALAQSPYPSRPIEIVIPTPAGGMLDLVGRMVADGLQQVFGRPVTLEYKPGGAAKVAIDYVARAEPNGYTIMYGASSGYSTAPAVSASFTYDPRDKLAPIIMAAEGQLVLLANPKLGVKSLAELVAYAKANPGKITYGSSGLGTTTHMLGEALKKETGIDIVHVPYRNGGHAVIDLLGGQIDILFETVSNTVEYVHAGKLTALVITTDSGSPVLPDVPTALSLNYKLISGTSTWTAFSAPAGTPQAIIDRLNREINAILARPDNAERLTKAGLAVIGGTPADFKKRWDKTSDLYYSLAKMLELRIQ